MHGSSALAGIFRVIEPAAYAHHPTWDVIITLCHPFCDTNSSSSSSSCDGTEERAHRRVQQNLSMGNSNANFPSPMGWLIFHYLSVNPTSSSSYSITLTSHETHGGDLKPTAISAIFLLPVKFSFAIFFSQAQTYKIQTSSLYHNCDSTTMRLRYD